DGVPPTVVVGVGDGVPPTVVVGVGDGDSPRVGCTDVVSVGVGVWPVTGGVSVSVSLGGGVSVSVGCGLTAKAMSGLTASTTGVLHTAAWATIPRRRNRRRDTAGAALWSSLASIGRGAAELCSRNPAISPPRPSSGLDIPTEIMTDQKRPRVPPVT
ncbi:MAG: hypothetical protein M3276_01425, partial [Actinomycetota bacterium]|nr:hypothetical protein [Actinomycetota bacterium]